MDVRDYASLLRYTHCFCQPATGCLSPALGASRQQRTRLAVGAQGWGAEQPERGISAGPVFVSGAIQRQSIALISRAFAGEQQEMRDFKADSDVAAPLLEMGKQCGVSTGELCWLEGMD